MQEASQTIECKISVELQEKSGLRWKTINSWSSNSKSSSSYVDECYKATKGKTYRAVAKVTAYSSNKSESKEVKSASQKFE